MKKRTFEESLKRIEDIIDLIESSDLNKSVELYKEGVEISAFCIDTLNQKEKEVMLLTKTIDDKFKETKLEDNYAL